jgi:hypothetical protein
LPPAETTHLYESPSFVDLDTETLRVEEVSPESGKGFPEPLGSLYHW